ncbi:MAG: FtsX-like permease family protein [Homoserinimonas sp.]
MIALPVAGLSGVAVVYQSATPTAHDRMTTELGANEAVLQMLNPGVPLQQHPTNPAYWNSSAGELDLDLDVASVLPAGTRILKQVRTTVTAETATGLASFGAIEGPSWDKSFAGRYAIAEGRAPRAKSEVMVTAAALPRLGVNLGDTVRIGSSNLETATVVGVLDAPILPERAVHFFGMAGIFNAKSDANLAWSTSYFLPDLALDWVAVKELNDNGVTALSRTVLADPPPVGGGFSGRDNGMDSMFAIVAIIAAFAAFEVILLAGAAFTVTARQQQRSLATITSVGASRGVLFRILTANGLVLGGLGGLLGIGVGIAAAAGFMAVTADGSSTQYYGFYVPWLWLMAIAAFAILIGWIASLLPARNASRFDIVAALRGARKPPPPSRRRPVLGLVMLVAGVVITGVGGVLMAILIEAGRSIPYGHPLLWLPISMLIAGPILGQLGVVLCGPLVLRVIASGLSSAGIGARLASRDSARNPSRAVPALASIMTTVFVAVFAMCMVSSGQQLAIDNYQYHRAVGQVAVPLTYVDYDDYTGRGSDIHAYEHGDAVEDALTGALDIAELRVFKSVAEPIHFPEAPESAGADVQPIAVALVPDANLCPSSPASPDFTHAANDPSTPEYRAASQDWRCTNSFLNSTISTGAHIIVGNAADLALALDREPSTDALRTLAAGGAVSLHPHYVHDDEFSIGWFANGEEATSWMWTDAVSPVSVDTIPAVVDEPEHPIYFGVFLSEATAAGLGLEYQDSIALGRLAKPPTTAQLDALNQAMETLPENGERHIGAIVEMGPQNFAAPLMWGLLALATLIAIASSAVAIGLARFDGRQDDATLSALGARRLVRRNFAFWQAMIIVGFGALLGAAMGLVPAVALSANPEMPFAAPWLQIGITVVALPVVIACGSWLLATRGQAGARRMAIS